MTHPSEHRDPTAHRGRRELRIAAGALAVGVLLLATKFLAYFLTGSAAIFSDAMESIVNVAAGAFALYSVSLANRPADAEHPYGHGKIEFLSAGFEGGMILAAAAVMVVKAADALLFHVLKVEEIGTGALLMLGAMVVNGGLGLYLVYSGKRSGSLTLAADGRHLITDAVTSAAALIALAVVHFFRFPAADPIAAILMGLFIARTGLQLLAHSAHGLMDKQDAGDETLLKGILDAHLGPDGKEPRICDYHKLRHRHSGRYHWVDFHILLPADETVRRGHDIASEIEGEIERALGEGDATAHIEPCMHEGCRTCRGAGPTTGN